MAGVLRRSRLKGLGYSGRPADGGCLGPAQEGWSETVGRIRRPYRIVCQGEMSPMLKPLTMSLSLAVALGVCSASMAGVGKCGIASPQGPCPSPQGPCPSPQSCGLSGLCGGGGGWKMPSLCSYFNKPKCYTYEWVLKKKRVRGCGGVS